MEPKFEVSSSQGIVMRVFEDKVIITQKGVMGFVVRGLAGEKTIYFSDITSVQFKNAGWTAGFIEFIFPGSGDRPGGAITGVSNENRFSFSHPIMSQQKLLAAEMEKVHEYIVERIEFYRDNKLNNSGSRISVADEILKFKSLLDSGVITQEEFDSKKKELLNL